MHDVRLPGLDFAANCLDDSTVYNFLPRPSCVELEAMDGDAVYIVPTVIRCVPAVVYMQHRAGDLSARQATARMIEGYLSPSRIVGRERIGDK